MQKYNNLGIKQTWQTVIQCDTETPMWHRKSFNLLDSQMTAEGTEGDLLVKQQKLTKLMIKAVSKPGNSIG
jgi:hypothetical protein